MKKRNISFTLTIFLLAAMLSSCSKSTPSDNAGNSNNTGGGTGNGNGSGTQDLWWSPAKYRDSLKAGVDVDWANNNQGMQYYNVQAVKDFKARGVSHVRLRMRNEITTDLLNHIDRIVKDCIDNNLIPVIAFQADTLKNYPFRPGVLENAVNWWKSIAEKLQNYPTQLSFDLMVECSDSLNNYPARLNEYFEKAVTEIRKTNPKRIIMISPRKLSSPDYLADLVIPSQANGYLIAEWHFYAAGPSKTNTTKLWTTGTAAEKQLITDKINTAYAWQQSKNIPTWVGAWMPGNYNDGDEYTVAEQIVFSNFMGCSLTRKNIPYAVNSDTKFYDRETNTWTFRASVLDAVINPVCQ